MKNNVFKWMSLLVMVLMMAVMPVVMMVMFTAITKQQSSKDVRIDTAQVH